MKFEAEKEHLQLFILDVDGDPKASRDTVRLMSPTSSTLRRTFTLQLLPADPACVQTRLCQEKARSETWQWIEDRSTEDCSITFRSR
jgi:hypothetical protein